MKKLLFLLGGVVMLTSCTEDALMVDDTVTLDSSDFRYTFLKF